MRKGHAWQEACMARGLHFRRHVWQGVCIRQGACMEGGMPTLQWEACMAGGHAWHWGGVRGRRDGHCSERYASYWNVCLVMTCFHYFIYRPRSRENWRENRMPTDPSYCQAHPYSRSKSFQQNQY